MRRQGLCGARATTQPARGAAKVETARWSVPGHPAFLKVDERPLPGESRPDSLRVRAGDDLPVSDSDPAATLEGSSQERLLEQIELARDS